MAYQLRGEDRGFDRAERSESEQRASRVPVPGKRTLTEALPPGHPGGGGVVQAKASSGALDAAPRPSLGALFGRPGSGQPLPAAVRRKMEQSLGAEFSAVRVHQGSEAAAIGARAFARGNDLYFAPGQYDPDSENGQRLLGHELAHVVQQRAGVARDGQGQGLEVNVDPALEAEADRAGEQAARGHKAEVSRGGSGGAGDTIQGDFFDDILLLLLTYYAFKIVGVVYDAYREAHAERIAEERRDQERAALDGARSRAHQLAEAAAQAAGIARRAAGEAKAAGDAALGASEAANQAMQEDAAAQQAADSTTAELHARRAQRAAAEAIAAATSAVVAVARSYAENATGHRETAAERLEASARSTEGAHRAADDTIEAASAAEGFAQEAAKQASANNLEAATGTLRKAVELAQQAGASAHKAHEHARAAHHHAASAKQEAVHADAAVALGAESPSAAQLAGATGLATYGTDAVSSAHDAIRDQRERTGEQARLARSDAEDASQQAEAADEEAMRATQGESEAKRKVIAQVRQAIAQQHAAAIATNKQVKKAAKGHEQVTTVPAAIARAQQATVVIAALLEEVDRAGLDKLPDLLERAMTARGAAEHALTEIRAECARHDAGTAVAEAEALARQLAARVRDVGSTVESAQVAMRKAEIAATKAGEAMAKAGELAQQARAASREISLDDAKAVERARQAEQLFREVSKLIAEARELYRSASEHAKQAASTAATVPDQAATPRRDALVNAKAVVSKASKVAGGLEAEQKRLAASEQDIQQSEEQLVRGRATGRDVAVAAKDQLGAIDLAHKRAVELENQGARDVDDQIAVLVEQASEPIARVASRAEELVVAVTLVGYELASAPQKLAEVDKGAKETDGAQALANATRLYKALDGEARALRDAAGKLSKAVDGARELHELTSATAKLATLKTDTGELDAAMTAAWQLHDELQAARCQLDDHIRASRPSKELVFTPQNLEGFSVVQHWEPRSQEKERYRNTYDQLATTRRVLDPANLDGRKEVPADQSKYHSNLMELGYLARALAADPHAHAQVGRMTFAALKWQLQHVGLHDHAAAFTEEQGEADSKLFATDIRNLCYEADGVVWHRDSVEVVQHKRTIAVTPTEKVAHGGRSVVEFEEQLRAAANQLGGWTAEGGRSALGGQPEYPPPGHNRTRVINIELPFARRPDDLSPYATIIAAVMSEKSGNGQGPQQFSSVDRIQITWGTGTARSTARFTHIGNGAYQSA